MYSSGLLQESLVDLASRFRMLHNPVTNVIFAPIFESAIEILKI